MRRVWFGSLSHWGRGPQFELSDAAARQGLSRSGGTRAHAQSGLDHEMSEPIERETEAHYAKGNEAGRLFEGHGVIELARTQEIILRHLPAPPGTILDVGGGPGVYACWLASLGYRVHLVDVVPLHVEQ